MSIIGRVIPNIFNTLKCVNIRPLWSPLIETCQTLNPGGQFELATRTAVRCHFPRPSEVKRIRKHGWVTRMSTRSGRRIIMNRILKGRWVYTH